MSKETSTRCRHGIYLVLYNVGSAIWEVQIIGNLRNLLSYQNVMKYRTFNERYFFGYHIKNHIMHTLQWEWKGGRGRKWKHNWHWVGLYGIFWHINDTSESVEWWWPIDEYKIHAIKMQLHLGMITRNLLEIEQYLYCCGRSLKTWFQVPKFAIHFH